MFFTARKKEQDYEGGDLDKPKEGGYVEPEGGGWTLLLLFTWYINELCLNLTMQNKSTALLGGKYEQYLLEFPASSLCPHYIENKSFSLPFSRFLSHISSALTSAVKSILNMHKRTYGCNLL